MATLKYGVLLKLLEDMKMGETATIEDRKPALLQIRSIMPVLEEGDFLPNRGFYLKISDASHAIYVSLPQDQNELISGNKLKLGQFIYVHKLEDAQPFPFLKDLTPLPGRRPCDGTPEEIGSIPNVFDSSNPDFIVEKGVIAEEKIMEISSSLRRLSIDSSDLMELRKRNDVLEIKGKFRSLSASKTRPGAKTSDVESRNSDERKSVDYDSDSDTTNSSVSSSTWISKRKSWNDIKIFGADQIFDSSAVKQNIRPPRCRSANVSPVRSVKYDSSDDNSSLISRRRVIGSERKLVRNSINSKTPASKINYEQAFRPIKGLAYDRKGAESGISWDSLPSNLVKLGKDVVKQRDSALFAAADALQEACAAEKLLNCLSKFSEFRSHEENDPHPRVDRFLDLQDDMNQTRLVMMSLTKTGEPNSSSSSSELTIVENRKKNATAWIKSAVALDLSPMSTAFNQKTVSRTTNTASLNIKTENRKSDDDDLQTEWSRGSTIPAATDLTSSLQDECRKMFLSYIEKYINELERKISLTVSDSLVAAMMYKIKRVSDWLDLIINKEANPSSKGCSNLDESELEACHRVKTKIYGILLKNVERTAMAFESGNR